MKTILISLIAVLLFSCQSDSPPALPAGHDRLPVITFSVDNQRDTVLITPGRVRISVAAGTFIGTGTVALEVREAITPAAMLLAGLTTVAENGKVLETGGMVYLGFPGNEAIAPGRSVSVEIPSSDRKPGMQPFTLVGGNGYGLVWRENPVQPVAWDSSRVAAGRRLWDEKGCGSCHNKGNLRKDATGPALGNVHLFRSQEYLRSFTRNSQRLIESGDSLAICVWESWNRSVMSSYEMLSDQEIDDIYYFVAAESERQQIGENEVIFPLYCMAETFVIGDPDATEGPPVKYRRRLTTVTNVDTAWIEREYEPVSDGGATAVQSPQSGGSLYYQISVYQPGWNNIDAYRILDDPAKETLSKSLHVRVTNEQKDALTEVFIMNLRERVIISMVRAEDGYICTYGPDLRIPKGPALLVGCNFGKQPGFSLREISITDDNDWEIELKPSTYEEMARTLEDLR